MNIVLITSGQLSANPRIVKEALALFDAGYKVSVIYCPLSPWAVTFDKNLIDCYPNISWIMVGYNKEVNQLNYLLSRIRRKFYHFIFAIFGNIFQAAERSLVLFSQELKVAACKTKADMYIGHNLGALPAVVTAALKFRAKAVFDFEDYHRGESSIGSLEFRCVKSIENSYVPKLVYATAASPLIAQAYLFHFPDFSVYPINNCFPSEYAPKMLPVLPKRPVKLFWFSQYVGKNRGLEQVIAALGRICDAEIELSLLGNCSKDLRDYFENEAISNGVKPSQLHFLSPVPEADIVSIASAHHIGLAVEEPYILNRDYCLTNKIFMYLLAGNAIIFSNTKAQKDFIQNNPNIGSIFVNGDIKQLASILSDYSKNTELLKIHREASFHLGKTYNWNNEKGRFLDLVNDHL